MISSYSVKQKLLLGFIALLVAAFAVNLAVGNFHPGFTGQPIAHADGLWNFLGMLLAGFGCALLAAALCASLF